ncbi:hypothetical protein HaLaN_15108 [Haematococcus lacustris]|uniref:Uncharacterized protein n=1 Tax=Haematococcus lacustris TaxID=44745 RepID=A0A699Z9N2_HAELA|nr:hypothetical protein HaLaN_15108 [Haematococcus lacustris]
MAMMAGHCRVKRGLSKTQGGQWPNQDPGSPSTIDPSCPHSTCQQPTLAGPAAYHHLPAPPHCPSA